MLRASPQRAMSPNTLKLVGREGADVMRALGSDVRLHILELLVERPRNINELGAALGASQPSVTRHVQQLEEAGLVVSDYASGVQGMQKICRAKFERLSLAFESATQPPPNVVEIEMPVGVFTLADVHPTCGLASRDRIIGYLDHPLAFHFPERTQAQLLWLGAGFVEYTFPNTMPAGVEVHSLDLMLEVCSETPGYDVDAPSDITVWINDVEIGSWQSPGDMGDHRGRLNPAWWPDAHTQYGFLKIWSVDDQGSYVDGVRASKATVSQLGIKPWQPTRVRIGVKEEAEHAGGFTLFGRGFGSYEQDIVLRLHHTGPRKSG
jgi:predicted transcriptional regulator